jgi:hypothetical protein
MKMAKTYIFLLVSLFTTNKVMAQNEVGPDGDKLLWILLILVLAVLALFFSLKKKRKGKPLFTRERVKVGLEKDRIYFPDYLKLSVKNTGNVDVDLERPLLIFDRFWMKRKFKLKGIDNRSLYPLYLEKGKTHTLNIDLNHFYSYDKKLKRYSKIKLVVSNVQNKKLGVKSVYTRKTLIKY